MARHSLGFSNISEVWWLSKQKCFHMAGECLINRDWDNNSSCSRFSKSVNCFCCYRVSQLQDLVHQREGVHHWHHWHHSKCNDLPLEPSKGQWSWTLTLPLTIFMKKLSRILPVFDKLFVKDLEIMLRFYLNLKTMNRNNWESRLPWYSQFLLL